MQTDGRTDIIGLIEAFFPRNIENVHKNSVRTSQETNCVPMTVLFKGIITVYFNRLVEHVERVRGTQDDRCFPGVKPTISHYLLSGGFPSDVFRR